LTYKIWSLGNVRASIPPYKIVSYIPINAVHLSLRYAMGPEIAATTQAWYCRNETGSSITHVLLQGTKSIMENAAGAAHAAGAEQR